MGDWTYIWNIIRGTIVVCALTWVVYFWVYLMAYAIFRAKMKVLDRWMDNLTTRSQTDGEETKQEEDQQA